MRRSAATRTLPAMTSGMPLTNSRTFSRIQVAVNFIGGKRLIRAVEHANADEHVRPSGTKPSRTRRETSTAEPRVDGISG